MTEGRGLSRDTTGEERPCPVPDCSEQARTRTGLLLHLTREHDVGEAEENQLILAAFLRR